MRTPHIEPGTSLVVERDQPVVAIPLIEDGREVVQYAVETDTDTPAMLPDSVRDALSLAGAWGNLDWDDLVATDAGYQRVPGPKLALLPRMMSSPSP